MAQATCEEVTHQPSKKNAFICFITKILKIKDDCTKERLREKRKNKKKEGLFSVSLLIEFDSVCSVFAKSAA